MDEAVFPLPSDFKVVIQYAHPTLTLEDEIKRHIEEIWKQEIIRTEGKIFNGTILSAVKFDGRQLTGHFVEYKHYLAQIRDPSLNDSLKIHPVCVSGYTFAGNQILFGKRSEHVTEYQNFYELVPAGGIDTSAVEHDQINVLKQLKTELKEEAGIDASMIRSIHPAFLILCPEAYEICAKIELDPAAIDFLGEHEGEYTRLIWVSKSELPAFVDKHQAEIIPLSLQLLTLFK